MQLWSCEKSNYLLFTMEGLISTHLLSIHHNKTTTKEETHQQGFVFKQKQIKLTLRKYSFYVPIQFEL
jgi:hypothetical protein